LTALVPMTRDAWLTTESGAGVLECDLVSTFSNVSLASADYECEHGRVGGDPTPACGCWRSELPAPTVVVHVTTPDLISILTPKEAPLMLTAAPERAALPAGTPEAPFGVKLDGTPRKSRAGRPVKLAPAPKLPPELELASAQPTPAEPTPPAEPTRAEILGDIAERVADVYVPAPKPSIVQIVHATNAPLLRRIIAEIDDEIARLEAAKAALIGVIT
jgi:hypothetical protein